MESRHRHNLLVTRTEPARSCRNQGRRIVKPAGPSKSLRLRDASVLLGAARDGLGLLMWPQESFAYADSYDEASGRYLGLKGGQHIAISEDSFFGLLVKPQVALAQLEAEKSQHAPPPTGANGDISTPSTTGGTSPTTGTPEPTKATEPAKPKRFHGTVNLDPQRVGRDAGKIAEEVIAHLASIIGSDVFVRLDIEASIPAGVPDNVVRIVTENCRTLKFTSQGFETD